MKHWTVLVTSQHLVPEAQQVLLDAGGRIEFMDEPITEAALLARLAAGPVEAVLLRGSKPLTAAVLQAAQGLKIVAKNGAGIDSVDLQAAKRLGIVVTVAAGSNADAVAEHAVAMMMALTRGLAALDRKVRAGQWAGAAYQGRDFRGCTVGILGFGAIGRSAARSAAALGAKVQVFDAHVSDAGPYRLAPDFDSLLATSDILSLHCPLTEETRGLIGRRALALLKPGAILINTARGPIVDEAALVEALKSGHLGAAGLDTFEVEPIDAGNPLLEFDNVILTPHVAGVTRDSAMQVAMTTARNIVDALYGRAILPAHVIVGPGAP